MSWACLRQRQASAEESHEGLTRGEGAAGKHGGNGEMGKGAKG